MNVDICVADIVHEAQAPAQGGYFIFLCLFVSHTLPAYLVCMLEISLAMLKHTHPYFTFL